jgi:hypothetical protein
MAGSNTKNTITKCCNLNIIWKMRHFEHIFFILFGKLIFCFFRLSVDSFITSLLFVQFLCIFSLKEIVWLYWVLLNGQIKFEFDSNV